MNFLSQVYSPTDCGTQVDTRQLFFLKIDFLGGKNWECQESSPEAHMLTSNRCALQPPKCFASYSSCSSSVLLLLQAVASMTINYARESVIDFTKPFMNLGISILFKAPKDPATEVSNMVTIVALW